MAFDRCMILDRNMERICDLDPEQVESPLELQDLISGERALELAYPVTGPGENVRRITVGAAAWAECGLYNATISGDSVVAGANLGFAELPAIDVSSVETAAKVTTQYTGSGGITFEGCLDSINVVVGGSVTKTVKRLGANLIQIVESPVLDGTVNKISHGLHNQLFAVALYYLYSLNPTTMAVEAVSDSYGGEVRTLTVGIDGSVYAGGTTTRTVRKYNPSTLAQEAESGGYGGTIYALTTGLDGSIYVGGATTRTVRKLNPTTLTLEAESASYGGDIYALTRGLDGSIYVAGLTTRTVRKLNASTLAQEAESANLGGNIFNLAVGLDGSIYAAVASVNTVQKLNPTTLTQEAVSDSYGGAIYALTVDADGSVYAGGFVTRKVRKYNSTTLTLEAESASYGGDIYTIRAARPWQPINQVIGYNTNVTGKSLYVRAVLEPSATLSSLLVTAYTVDDSAQLESGHIVVIPDMDGNLQPFEIIRAGLVVKGTKLRKAWCEHLFYELGKCEIADYDWTNAIPSTAIAEVLTDARWELGDIDSTLTAVTKTFTKLGANPLEMLRKIESEWEAEISFRVTVSGTGFANFYVDFKEKDLTFSGRRFEFGFDLHGVAIHTDRSQLYTALYGHALGDDLDISTGEEKPMTFASVEWSIAAGDPCDKPLGQTWVGDEQARLLYGPVWGGERKHIFGVYDSQATTPEMLLAWTWVKLQRVNRPQVTVEAEVADLEKAKLVDIRTGELVTLDHEEIRLGQTVQILARDHGVLADVEARIIKIERYHKESERTRLLIGDPLYLDSDFLSDLKDDVTFKDRRRRQLDRGRGGQTVTIASEEHSLYPYYALVVVPDGATTLKPYIDEAIALLPSGGGTIVFQDGLYVWDSTAELGDNVHIKGQSEGTVLQLKDGADVDAYCFYASGKTGIKISDLKIDGNKVNQAAGMQHGICIENCEEVTVLKVPISNFNGNGIYLYGQNSKIQILNNIVIANDQYGIYTDVAVGSGHTMEDITVAGNIAKENFYNIYLLHVLKSNICDNQCHNPTDDISIAIWEGSDHNVITGNIVSGSNYGGLFIQGDRNIVSENVCYQNTVDGMYVEGNYNDIQNNKCYDNQDGIWIAVGGTGNLVINNDLEGNPVGGGLVDMGTGTITTSGNRS